MNDILQIAEMIRRQEGTDARCQLAQYLNNMIGKIRTFSPEDKRCLSELVSDEAKRLTSLIPTLGDYREKDEVFTYADTLIGIISRVFPKPEDVPADKLALIRALYDTIHKERFVENAVDELFEKDHADADDARKMLCFVSPVKDEYQKGKFFQGLLHYEQKMGQLDDDAKAVIADYLASELERLLDGDHDKDVCDALELAVDAAKLFMNDRIAALLNRALSLRDHAIVFFALSSLLAVKRPVPEQVVRVLAEDLIYADMTYHALTQAGLAHLFPATYATPDYLAKSDLVHWLTYPTELGCAPDEVEYLGIYRKGFLGKGEAYHILRFRSSSDTLSDDLKGQWLIGWSNEDGGTFSNFDRYDLYDKGDRQKTVKNIGKNLI